MSDHARENALSDLPRPSVVHEGATGDELIAQLSADDWSMLSSVLADAAHNSVEEKHGDESWLFRLSRTCGRIANRTPAPTGARADATRADSLLSGAENSTEPADHGEA